MPKFDWGRANKRRGSREFRVTPEKAKRWFEGDQVTKIQYGPVSYAPNGFTGREERVVEALGRMKDDLQKTRAQRPQREPVVRCHGCHSSEFDATGKCAYCRQYRSA